MGTSEEYGLMPIDDEKEAGAGSTWPLYLSNNEQHESLRHDLELVDVDVIVSDNHPSKW